MSDRSASSIDRAVESSESTTASPARGRIRLAGRRRRGLTATVILAAVALVLSLTAVPASAAGCGFLGLFACAPTAPTGAPGTPVPQLTQVNQSTDGGTTGQLSTIPMTTKVGTPNAGTVPVVGLASARADDGAFVAYETRMTAQALDLMVYSPALKGAAPVRVLLPPDYFTNPTATYPSLYLIHGGNDKTDYQSWTENTNLAAEVANVHALIVMPSVGSGGYATNYWNYGSSTNGLQYDTFVATEVAQLLQRGYRANKLASIAGISSGGNSALDLAFLHKGQFAAAAAYSGMIDTSDVTTQAIISAGSILEFRSPYQMWGSYLLNGNIWKAANPAANVAKLAGIALFVSSGNGNPGPLDSDPNQKPDNTEIVIQKVTKTFLTKAAAAGIPVTADMYGNGWHNWKYWMPEFAKSWSMLSASLGITDQLVLS